MKSSKNSQRGNLFRAILAVGITLVTAYFMLLVIRNFNGTLAKEEARKSSQSVVAHQ
ncbi:hypothetical protein IIU_06062 [Bacillus cereus VD133]|uniref:Uncharacterized protein n=1 Tax=Bacillus cereus VD133 TaxID=1053233 RepID=A0A9W5PKZ4_BACCE|nr:hypothetical protein [Bacillus cereus]EOO25918.1 hypothetical protein IIU_06062 [Bacillus cereus VD133]